MLDLLIRLQKIDRRWVYLTVAVACSIPFCWHALFTNHVIGKDIQLSIIPSKETRGIYNAIEKVAADNAKNGTNKIVLLDSAWDAGSQGENRGQTECVIDHMFRRNVKFAAVDVGGAPLAPMYVDMITDKLLSDENGKFDGGKSRYGVEKKYGEDWVNLGYKPVSQFWQVMSQIAKNVRIEYTEDSKKRKIDSLPLMKHFHNIDDVGLIYSVTYAPPEDWISFIHGVYGTPVGFGCAGIQSTTTYRYIESKQLVGMLVGVRGATEYDKLLYPNDPSKRVNLGSRLMVPLSFGHIVIIIAIVIGNIGYFAGKRRRS